jgi:hypothetical protein
MTLEQWQIALRHEFGQEQKFSWRTGQGTDLFGVPHHQPHQRRRLSRRHPWRSPGHQLLFLSRLFRQYLGTCKHIEFTLAALPP